MKKLLGFLHHHHTLLTLTTLNTFYWTTSIITTNPGPIANIINDIWYSSQDAGFNPQELAETAITLGALTLLPTYIKAHTPWTSTTSTN